MEKKKTVKLHDSVAFVLMHFVPRSVPNQKSLRSFILFAAAAEIENSKAILYAVRSDFLHDSVCRRRPTHE